MKRVTKADEFSGLFGMACAWVLVNCGPKMFRRLLRDVLAWDARGLRGGGR